MFEETEVNLRKVASIRNNFKKAHYFVYLVFFFGKDR